MILINLLPHREAARKRRKELFFASLGASAFAGALMQCEPLGEGEHDILIAQGVEMGRPSEIALQVSIRSGALVSAEIGGRAVVVSRGELHL